MYAYVRDNPTTLTDPSGLVSPYSMFHDCGPDESALCGSSSPQVPENSLVGEKILFIGSGDFLTHLVNFVSGNGWTDTPSPPAPATPKPPAVIPGPIYKDGVPPPAEGSALADMLNCTTQCYMSPYEVSSTSELGRGNPHTANDSHGQGKAADVKVGPENQGEKITRMLKCAESCGARYGQDEYHHPSPGNKGPHIHLSVEPGGGGSRGDLPDPTSTQ